MRRVKLFTGTHLDVCHAGVTHTAHPVRRGDVDPHAQAKESNRSGRGHRNTDCNTEADAYGDAAP